MLGVSVINNIAIIKGGELPANTVTELSGVTGGFLLIGVFSGASVYWCNYWTTDCTKITGVADFAISKVESTTHVKVNPGTYNANWLFIGFRP